MLSRLFLLVLTLGPAAALAEGWTVEKSQPLSAAEGLTCAKLEVRRADGTTARAHFVTFSAKTHAFALMDDPDNAYNLATAAEKRGAVAAVNGGYFHPDRTALGLRVRQGKELHPLEKSRLLSGLIIVNGDRLALVRVGEFKRTATLREAIQTGPFLVDGGKPVAGLNATRADARTVVISDGANRFGLVSTSGLTLADTGALLATPNLLPGLKIARALNLDGGSSTGLWVRSEPPLYLRELRNVRDFLAVVPRSK